jgi:hypothetical protein
VSSLSTHCNCHRFNPSTLPPSPRGRRLSRHCHCWHTDSATAFLAWITAITTTTTTSTSTPIFFHTASYADQEGHEAALRDRTVKDGERKIASPISFLQQASAAFACATSTAYKANAGIIAVASAAITIAACVATRLATIP